MKNISKFLILIGILVIPLTIAVFLKLFGSNEFSIPVYYSNGTNNPFEECASVKDQFYANSLSQDKGETSNLGLVIFFKEDKNLSAAQLSNIGTRLEDLFKGKPVERITYHELDMNYEGKNFGKSLKLDPDNFLSKMHCDAITDTVNQFILIDAEAKIRGYYGVELDEIDRLIVETKILLEK